MHSVVSLAMVVWSLEAQGPHEHDAPAERVTRTLQALMLAFCFE